MVGMLFAAGVKMFARFGVVNMHSENLSAPKFLGKSAHGNNGKNPRVRLIEHQRAANFGVVGIAAYLRHGVGTGAGKKIENSS